PAPGPRPRRSAASRRSSAARGARRVRGPPHRRGAQPACRERHPCRAGARSLAGDAATEDEGLRAPLTATESAHTFRGTAYSTMQCGAQKSSYFRSRPVAHPLLLSPVGRAHRRSGQEDTTMIPGTFPMLPALVFPISLVPSLSDATVGITAVDVTAAVAAL